MATKKRASRRKKRSGVAPLLVGLAVASIALLATLQWVVRQPSGPGPDQGGGEQQPSPSAGAKPETRQPPKRTAERAKPVAEKPPQQVAPKTVRKSTAVTPKPSPPIKTAPTPGPRTFSARQGAKPIPIAIVLDDCGRDQALMKRASSFPWKMTFAVLPHLSDSAESAAIGHAAGQEIILHQPMEPFGTASDPGEGAILTGMERMEVARLLKENLRSIPHVRGLNNHMGSKATADAPLMEHVLHGLLAVKGEHPGLYFLDSKTWAGTVAYDTVRGHGLPTAMRTKFLDNEDQTVKEQFETFLAAAEEAGSGIGIGHLKATTLAVLDEQIRALKPGKFELVFASELAR